MKVADNLTAIQSEISKVCQKIDREPTDITIIAVTKYVTIERAKEALQAGIHDLGENRLEGFAEKHAQIGEQACWHFIGTLQSRKVKEVIHHVDFLHSLDRLSLAKEIDKRADEMVECFIQVNASGESTKHGLAVEDVIPFVEQLANYQKIRVAGLMTMAPHTDDQAQIRKVFSALRQLRDEIRTLDYGHAPCHYLSMGMSNDYQIAIEEGATHIRLGSDLVGPYTE
ncbi:MULTISPECIES: YggS family pyridoxal phosphate-dependent enzyme [Gracilibacillus]|uniref:YggS family pyridoxal phosphate-dependent enzyme n=1 Tax=Gracilibacillus TaxID=74385 RepID=UPI000826DFA3|nr:MULTISPECIES: YggS family pyridoxal phosphate-dependent enzyme [Gracilibacillus]